MLLAEYSAAFFVFSAAISLVYKGVKNKDFGGENRIFAGLRRTIFDSFHEEENHVHTRDN